MVNKKEKTKNMLQTPKGMHDILADEYVFYQSVFEKAEKVASYYGFQPIQTPILEKTELFTVGVGTATDIVEKQMYSFRTKGGDHLSLRPEGTAPVMRAYLEHGMHTLPQPVMLWYKGSFFRHENPQKGRTREFQQFSLEIIGEPKPIAEVIVIRVLKSIFEELDFPPLIVHINSIGDKECRPAYRKELVNYYRRKINNLCPNCKRRLKENPLRLLDCKEEKCIELKAGAPQMANHLCSSCKQHFREVLEALDSADIFYVLDNHLVRGLDYYTRTVFEIFESTTVVNSNALAGGGRYDYLGKTLGKKDVAAVGVSIGVDRIVQLMHDKKILPKQKKQPKVFLIQLGNAAKYKSLEIIEMFRKAHLPLNQSISKDSLRGQLNLASKLNMAYALILGQQEVLKNSIILRDMKLGNQETINFRDLVEVIKKKITYD
jgi:histidyl-tRNA synthetase